MTQLTQYNLQFVARNGINKSKIIKQLFPSYQITYFTKIAELIITDSLDLNPDEYHKYSNDVVEIEIENLFAAYQEMILTIKEEVKFDLDLFNQEFVNANLVYKSKEHQFNNIRGSLAQIKNVLMHLINIEYPEFVLKTIEHFNSFESIEQRQKNGDTEKLSIIDIKTIEEIQLAAKYNNLFLLIPFKQTIVDDDFLFEQLGDKPDLNQMSVNHTANYLSDMAFSVFKDYFNFKEMGITTDQQIGICTFKLFFDDLLEDPIVCIFVNQSHPDIELTSLEEYLNNPENPLNNQNLIIVL